MGDVHGYYVAMTVDKESIDVDGFEDFLISFLNIFIELLDQDMIFI
jgi:hypothetical protein